MSLAVTLKCYLLLFVLFFNLMASTKLEIEKVQDAKRKCIAAEVEPSLNSSSCYPLNNYFTYPFCKEHGIDLPNYVYATPADQDWRNNAMIKSEKSSEIILKLIKKKYPLFKHSAECKKQGILSVCRYYFPSCDTTKNVVMKRKICKETCLMLLNGACREIIALLRPYVLADKPYYDKFFTCEAFPVQNAGESPECWYYNEDESKEEEIFNQELESGTDCLYLNGSDYYGNISVTASGIPCQSWSSQCPHRHTMNTTYPELNYAKNFCRNPKNSGKRPWCFTTNRKKRWEYCDIPKCIPVDGVYGSWYLASKCNTTCGQGFETWKRNCTNPAPRYGGRNCSHLGNGTEYRTCTEKSCNVNGGYGNWTLSSQCSASCGSGFEIWQRACDNPVPEKNGTNCSALGNSTEYRKCAKKPCPTEETHLCKMKDCPASKWNVTKIGIAIGITAATILVGIFVFVFICRKLRHRTDPDFEPYAVLVFFPHEMSTSRKT